MSKHTTDKATRLLQDGRIEALNNSLTSFRVEGDSGVYSVRLMCDCPAGKSGRPCGHLEAALRWANGNDDERKIMGQLREVGQRRRAAEACEAEAARIGGSMS